VRIAHVAIAPGPMHRMRVGRRWRSRQRQAPFIAPAEAAVRAAGQFRGVVGSVAIGTEVPPTTCPPAEAHRRRVLRKRHGGLQPPRARGNRAPGIVSGLKPLLQQPHRGPL